MRLQRIFRRDPSHHRSLGCESQGECEAGLALPESDECDEPKRDATIQSLAVRMRLLAVIVNQARFPRLLGCLS